MRDPNEPPLDEAPIDRVSLRELKDRQLALFDVLADEAGDGDGCGPYGCRSGEPVAVDDGEGL